MDEHDLADKTQEIYYSRSVGLFRVCFPYNERPPLGTPGLFLNAVEVKNNSNIFPMYLVVIYPDPSNQ